jgi:hypothetical protein
MPRQASWELDHWLLGNLGEANMELYLSTTSTSRNERLPRCKRFLLQALTSKMVIACLCAEQHSSWFYATGSLSVLAVFMLPKACTLGRHEVSPLPKSRNFQ